jgi:hypothetical protein
MSQSSLFNIVYESILKLLRYNHKPSEKQISKAWDIAKLKYYERTINDAQNKIEMCDKSNS